MILIGKIVKIKSNTSVAKPWKGVLGVAVAEDERYYKIRITDIHADEKAMIHGLIWVEKDAVEIV